jgi:hypothetical protein
MHSDLHVFYDLAFPLNIFTCTVQYFGRLCSHYSIIKL